MLLLAMVYQYLEEVIIMNKDKFIRRPEGKGILTKMDEFFRNVPAEYRINYYRNLTSVDIEYVSNIDNCCDALYDPYGNIIWYSLSESLPHELFHMASNDREKNRIGLGFGEVSAIDEGIAEYLKLMLFELNDSKFYPFEAICGNIILDYPLVLGTFFMADHDGFIQLFREENTVETLMNKLNSYTKTNGYLLKMLYTDGVNAKYDKDALIDIRIAVNNVIKYLTLLAIQNSDKININEYINKLLWLLNSNSIFKYFKIFYPEYMDDTKEIIRKLVK